MFLFAFVCFCAFFSVFVCFCAFFSVFVCFCVFLFAFAFLPMLQRQDVYFSMKFSDGYQGF